MEKTPLPVRIAGVGKGLPKRCVPTSEVAAKCGFDAEEAIARTGVARRHWVSDGETALDLGVHAAREALAGAGLERSDIDVVVNASGTPIQPIPDGAALLAHRLAIVGANAFSVHTTCISFLTGFYQAALLIASGAAERALVVSMEVGSIALNMDQPESALLIGDGAAAVVLGRARVPGQGILSAHFECHPDGGEFARIRGGGSALPFGATDDWDMYKFDMKGLPVVLYCLRRMPAFLERLGAGQKLQDLGLEHVITHQPSRAGMLIFSKFIDEGLLRSSLADYGNVIAASIPLTLADTEIRENSRIALLGAGAGISLGGLVLQT